MDRFSYAILGAEKELLALKSYDLTEDSQAKKPIHESIQTIFLEDEALKLSYDNVFVGINNPNSTLIPNKLYDADSIDAYLIRQVASVENHKVFVDDISKVDAQNIYSFDQESFHFLKGYLPNAKFFHASTSLLNGIFTQGITETHQKHVHINVKNSHFQIALLDGTELVFFNSFSYQNEHDFIYHVLLVFEQFKLSTSETPVTLTGQITTESKIYRILYRYINSVYFAPTTASNVVFGNQSKSQSSHFYFDLFSLELCV